MLNTERAGCFAGEADAEIQKKLNVAAKILDEYGSTILAAVNFHVDNTFDVDDILQNFFLSLVHKPIPENIQDVKGYLCRAVKNDALDAIRRAKHYRSRIYRYTLLRMRCMEKKDPQNVIVLPEEKQKLLELIERHIPRHEAQAIIQRYIYGRKTADAAEVMGVSKRTYSRYLCTGLKKARQLF